MFLGDSLGNLPVFEDMNVTSEGSSDYLVIDARGYNTILKGEAATFLSANDSRLLVNTVVTNISQELDHDTVTVTTHDGACFRARHAIITFSLGALQKSALSRKTEDAVVAFDPPLLDWKRDSIAGMSIGIYTKIFMQFPKQFWPDDMEEFMYASQKIRGWYITWQSLSLPGFFPGSNILFVTVINDISRRVEAQDDEETKAEVLAVLRQMYGEENVPEPTDFMYPRWGMEPWSYGSYSFWPTGYTIAQHQNLRSNVSNLWFAGEHTSFDYGGFVYGAWFEGQATGAQVAACLNGNATACAGGGNYPVFSGALNSSAVNQIREPLFSIEDWYNL